MPGRYHIIAAFSKLGIQPVMLEENETKLGGVETFQEAKKCAELFKKHANEIIGVLVVLATILLLPLGVL